MIDHTVNKPVILTGESWKWGQIGVPVQVGPIPGPFKHDTDEEELMWWSGIICNAMALTTVLRDDPKQRKRCVDIHLGAYEEIKRSFGHDTSRKIYCLCAEWVRQHLREDPERAHAVGSEAILWAQGYLCAIVVQAAYHKAGVKGKGLKAVDAITLNIENGIRTAFPEDIASEILHMKAIRMMRGE